MRSTVSAQQDPKKRFMTIAAASVCIVVGLSFAVYSLLPGDPVGTKILDESIGQTPPPVAAVKPKAGPGAVSPAQPGAVEPQAKPSKTGFEPMGK